ncbi:hypothetical protein CN918_27625 [Priestia megaterium]|nr:hypothetical protein CN918_27625 [Priestia megaterium]
MAGIESGKLSNYNNKIQVFGMGSGLDIQGLIDAQLQVERLKIDPFYNTQDYYKQEKTLWNQFKTKLSDLGSLANDIKNLTDVNQTTTYSKDGFVNVTAKGDAVAGSYNITVQKVATAHKIMSDAVSSSTTALGYEGTLNFDGETVNVKATMSLTDIAKEINKSNATVDASVVGGHLFLTSQKTGEASEIKITATGDGKKVSLSDNTALGVKITGDISGLNSQYNLEVQQLATKQKVESNVYLNQDTNLNYSGSFTLNGQTISVSTNEKLSDIVTKINNNSATGVKASISNNKLVFESANTGAANTISLSDNTTSIDRAGGLFQYIGMTDGTNFTHETQAAQDAEYTIDGTSYTSSSNTSTDLSGVELTLKAVTTGPVQLNVVNDGVDVAQSLGLTTSSGTFKNEIQQGQNAEYTIEGITRTSETNTITDAVADMTFDLLKETTEPIEIKVTQNSDALLEKVKKFVDGYNSIMQYINDSSKKEGVLQGEALMRSAKEMMRSILYDKSSNGMMLYELGIQGNGAAKDGTIKLDEAKFKTALTENYDNVLAMLTGLDGMGKKFGDRLNEYTKTQGMLDIKTESLDKSIERLDKTIERKESAYEKLQESLINKYSKLESLMSALNKQKDIMKAQLDALDGNSDS